jgi:hypothetical protein
MARDYLNEGQFRVDIKRKDNFQSIDKLFECNPLENYTNLDGIIGRCLYLMKRYGAASEFFKDLSKRAILSKSIEEIMHTVPIIGFLMAAGSFTQAFYNIFSNRFSTDSKKMAELTGFVIKAGATIGSSIVGALVGQALIPIPVVGALVGTVVGGLLGERGCREVTSMINSVHFERVVDYLGKNIREGCYWEARDEFYEMIDVKKKNFEKYIPAYMEKNVFITIVGFVLVCFHESSRLAKHNQERSRQHQEEEELAKKGKRLSASEYQKEKEFEDQVQKLSEFDGFKTEFDINHIISFLEDHHAEVYEHYEVL